jgi:VWFA-related protein
MTSIWLLALALQAPLTFKASTEVVRVDVLVLRGGRPASGLRIQDFEIRENGVRQNIQTLGTDANTPIDMLLLFDGSASVRGSRHQLLLEAASAAMKGLRPTDRAGLLLFSHEVRRLTKLTSDFDSVTDALEASVPFGSTSLGDSLVAASLAFDRTEARRLVFLFTDGADTSSFLQDYQVIEALARGNVLVYSFTLEETGVSPGPLLRAATDTTGGRAVTERNPKKLPAAFREALEEVRARYLLSYTPDTNTAPGWRRLEVKVKGGGRISARKGYAR